jgi:pyrroline-5-carboxylate reductase
MENIYQFLGTSTLGMFGAGHLGRAMARGLLDAGFPSHKLTICHRGSADTHRQLMESGLSECIVDCKEVICRSKIVLYVVRPQDYRSLADFTIPPDCLLVSFLAGVELGRIPLSLAESQRVRVMPSAPDTLRRQNGIAAIYPSDNVVAQAILSALKLRIFPLKNEADIHAFTALGPCLPIALTYWEGLGCKVDENELLDIAARFDLPEYSRVLQWARSVQPRNLSAEERDCYIAQATTPGGVTEAILGEIKVGRRLSVALVRGIHRSRELAAL